MKLHSINEGQRLYVIASGDGFSCYGFDVLDRKARGILKWIAGHAWLLKADEIKRLGWEIDSFPAPGTEEHFAYCRLALRRGEEFCKRHDTRCPIELNPALRGHEGKLVEIDHLGERVKVRVGKSTGWMPCHLAMIGRRKWGEPIYSDATVYRVIG